MKLKTFTLFSVLVLSACTELNSTGYPSYPSNGYPTSNYPSYPAGNRYPSYPSGGTYYPPPAYPPPGGYGYPNSYPPPSYDCRAYGNCPGTYYPPPNNNRWENNHHHNHDRPRDNVQSPPINTTPVIPPPSNSTGSSITPNCPSGTVFTGSTCKITDSKLKRPGGDGNINPCPKGMWVSGGKCVGN